MILWKIGTPGFEILEKSFFLVMAGEPPHFYSLLKNAFQLKLAQQPSFGSLWEQTEVFSRGTYSLICTTLTG